MVLSAPGTVVVVEHIAPLVPVHIVAPGRQFEKQGRKPGSFIVTAMLLWECCGNRWRNCCTLNLWRTGRWCTATEPSGGGGGGAG